MKILTLLMILSLSACAYSPQGKVSAGGAVYSYSKVTPKGDSCTVKITSARQVSGGEIEIDENCKMRTVADKAGGAQEALDAIAEIVSNRLP